MGWIQKLHQTYEQCASVVDASEAKPWPLSHLVKKAHVEVVVDSKGNFRRARALNRIEAPTLIPVTEFSAGRTANVAPHPLCEEIGYCAADFPMVNVKKQEAFEAQLLQWCRSTDVAATKIGLW